MTLDLRISALVLLAIVGCNRPSASVVRPPPRDSETLSPVATPQILRAVVAWDGRRDAVFAYRRDDGRTEIAEATNDGTARPLIVVDRTVLSLVSRADDELVFVVQGRGYLEAPQTSDQLLKFDGSATSDLGDRLLAALPTENRGVLVAISAVDIDEAGRVVTMVTPYRDADRYYPGHFLCVLSPMDDTCERVPAGGASQVIADRSFTYLHTAHGVQRRARDSTDRWEDLGVDGGLVALSGGGVAVHEPNLESSRYSPRRGTLHVFAPDGTAVRRITDFGRLVGHRVDGGWEVFEDFEAVSSSGGTHYTSYERVWAQLIVSRLHDGELIEVGHHDAREGYVGNLEIVLPDGSLRIETDDGVFVIAPPPSP